LSSAFDNPVPVAEGANQDSEGHKIIEDKGSESNERDNAHRFFFKQEYSQSREEDLFEQRNQHGYDLIWSHEETVGC